MDSVEKWRYRCPRGHTGWEIAGQAFWCSECYRRAEDESGRFERLHDRKTGERIDTHEARGRLQR